LKDHAGHLLGIVERRNGDNSTERFIAFFVDEPTIGAEKRSLVEAWSYTKSLEV
jgi:hypothetical protein